MAAFAFCFLYWLSFNWVVLPICDHWFVHGLALNTRQPISRNNVDRFIYIYILIRYDGFVMHICLEKCGMKLLIHSETLMVALMSWCRISDSLFSKTMLTELWDIYTNMLQWVCCEHNMLTCHRCPVRFSGSDNLVSTTSWKSKHMFGKVWDEIINPFANFNDCTVEVWELIVISSHIV